MRPFKELGFHSFMVHVFGDAKLLLHSYTISINQVESHLNKQNLHLQFNPIFSTI